MVLHTLGCGIGICHPALPQVHAGQLGVRRVFFYGPVWGPSFLANPCLTTTSSPKRLHSSPAHPPKALNPPPPHELSTQAPVLSIKRRFRKQNRKVRKSKSRKVFDFLTFRLFDFSGLFGTFRVFDFSDSPPPPPPPRSRFDFQTLFASSRLIWASPTFTRFHFFFSTFRLFDFSTFRDFSGLLDFSTFRTFRVKLLSKSTFRLFDFSTFRVSFASN